LSRKVLGDNALEAEISTCQKQLVSMRSWRAASCYEKLREGGREGV